MTMTAYALHCSVCSHISEGRRAWLEHLLESKHQNAAKQDVSRWNKALRNCAVVIFASFPVACYEVLEHFSKDNDIVTDFVAIPSKSNSGIIQFESREKVKQVIAKFGGVGIRIENQLVQLKKASKCLELEWKQLIQEFEQYSLPQKKSHMLDEEVIKAKAYIDCAHSKLFNVQSNQLVSKMKLDIPAQASKLENQYEKIRKEIEISDIEYNKALNIMTKLSEIFSEKYPQCKFYMYRDWYLKLQTYGGGNVLRIFLDYKGELTGSKPAADDLFRRSTRRILESEDAQKILHCTQKQTDDDTTTTGHFIYSEIGFPFHLDTHIFLAIEVQTCRLLKYLLSFDARAKQALMLVHYWAKINLVSFANQDEAKNEYHYIPEPSALEWLVMIFLCQKQIVPTPREIVNNAGKKTQVFRNGDVDIGFDTSEDLVDKWKNKQELNSSILDVLELVRYIFTSMISLRDGGVWILNTRDGEIIRKADFMGSTEKLASLTKMTEEEISIVKRNKFSRVNLLHPLHPHQKFVFLSCKFITSCFSMNLVAQRLTKFIKAHKSMSNQRGRLKLDYVFKTG